LVVLVGLAIDQIAQSGLSSLSVIYYSAQLFSTTVFTRIASTTVVTIATTPANITAVITTTYDSQCFFRHVNLLVSFKLAV
ncbi:hypothetical protein, partial [Klebsiella pneumoniae]|uniref:hypothetical protein n=1 Tax=Klebsiella pneumoniae TaxID=573 RepID=UPI001C6F6F59